MKIKILVLLLLINLHLFADNVLHDEKLKNISQFTDMRMQYSTRSDFQGGWVADAQRESLIKIYNEETPKGFISGSEAWLRKCPVDAKVHLMRASLLLKAGDIEGHFYHRFVYYGLLTSIAASGDGKSLNTAYKVISVDEEYTFLNHIGGKLISQKLVAGPCDAMNVELNGTNAIIYFNVSIPMSATKKALEKDQKK